MLERRDLQAIEALIQQRISQAGMDQPIGFVPGITTPIGQPQVLPFIFPSGGGDIAADQTETDSQVLSSEVGMLWQEISFDSTGEFEWNMKVSGFDLLTLDGKKIHSNTFKGDGQNGDIVWGHTLPTAMYWPGGTTISMEVTDLSGTGNAVRATLTGARVRPGSPFEEDMLRMLAYNGMG